MDILMEGLGIVGLGGLLVLAYAVRRRQGENRPERPFPFFGE
jgi:hypothetical protein